jgi:hypothetical protein
MPTTYEAIATVTVGSGGAANIEFTSIPATFTDLAVKTSLRTDGSSANGWQSIALTFNNSTSSYSGILLIGRGDLSPASITSATSSIEFAAYSSDAAATANTFGSNEIYIPNYTSSNNKSVSSDVANENNAARALAGLVAGLWSNSAAITSVKLVPNSGSFVQHSTATLYGIKNS